MAIEFPRKAIRPSHVGIAGVNSKIRVRRSGTRARASVQARVCAAALRASLIGKYLGERETHAVHSLSAGRKLPSTIASPYRTSRDSERRDRDELKESETKTPDVNDLW